MSSEVFVSASPAPEVRAATASRIAQLIGNTPIVRLRRVGDPAGAPIYVKMEQNNPSGSIRDRYIAEILERSVEAGQTVPGDTIALAGLDDSGLSASLLGGQLGLRTRVFAPRGSSHRLLQLVERFGAEVVWTEEAEGLAGAAKQAASWAREAPDRLYVDAFRRQAVQEAYAAIANEILLALRGQPLGSFITSVTTGGTFREVSRRLREHHPLLRVGGAVLLDIDTDALGAQPQDLLQRFSMEDAWAMRDEVARKEGLMLSPKGAAGVALALQLQRKVAPDHIIVALNPDAGQRYLGWESQPVFRHHWVPGV
jgi:cysteine synthase